MPTYVYRFIDTGETIEVRQSFDDAPLTEAPHPSDGSLRPVKKVFTPVGITFKGSGFYKTDSGATSKSTKSESSGASSEKSSSGDSGSSTTGSGTSSTPSTTAPPASSSGSSAGGGTASTSSTS
ncbi:MAG: FmdB family zinc ribbon protein [Actinomycetota bacterium]